MNFNNLSNFVKVEIIFSLLFIPILELLVNQPLEHHLAKSMVDDSFYYLGYAYNLANGNGPTFDGIVFTNGVQALWAITLTCLAWLVPDRHNLIYVMMIFSIILEWISGLILVAALRNLLNIYNLIIMSLLYLLFISDPSIATSGMEIPVVLFSFAVAIYNVLHLQSTAIKNLLLTGCSISLLIIARLDLLIFIPLFVFIALWRIKLLIDVIQLKNQAILCLFWLILPSFILLSIYLFINWLNFGLIFPVSGVVKIALHEEYLNSINGGWTLEYQQEIINNMLLSWDNLLHKWLNRWMFLPSISSFVISKNIHTWIIIGIWFIFILTLIKILAKVNSNLEITLLMLFTIFSCIFHTYIINFRLQDGLNYWYHIPDALVFILVLSWGIGDFFNIENRRYVRIKTVLFSIIILIFIAAEIGSILIVSQTPILNTSLVVFKQTADWINDNVPANEIIGSWDSGIIGYFTPNNPILNLDGLMNNKSYVEEVLIHKTKSTQQYLNEHHVTWVTNFIPNEHKNYDNFRWLSYQCLEHRWNKHYYHYGIPSEMLVFKIKEYCQNL